MIERFNHDANGKRANNRLLGYSGYVMAFDESGKRRTSLTYQNADGSPATHLVRGYHAVKTEYDKEGNRTRSRFEDSAGNLVNRKDSCAAIYQYSYDDRNRLVSMRLLDDEMKPTHHCEEEWHETTYQYHPNGPLSHIEKKRETSGTT